MIHLAQHRELLIESLTRERDVLRAALIEVRDARLGWQPGIVGHGAGETWRELVDRLQRTAGAAVADEELYGDSE